MATQQEIIQKFMTTLSNSKAITGSDAVNEAFKEASDKRFSTMQEAIDAFLRDCKAAKNTDDFLRNYCGIILDNEDNGSITGLDAGGIKLKTDETIVLETSEVKRLDTQYLNQWDKWTAGEEVSLDNGNATVDKSGTLYFEKLGLTVKVPDYDKIIEAANGSDKAKSEEAQRKLIVVNGLYSWWIEGALQLIKDSYGDEFSFENNKKTITLELENNGNNGTSAAVNAVNTAGLFTLKINMYYLSTINSEDHDGKLTNQKGEFLNEYLDGVLAHELTHGIMASKFGLLGGDIKWFLLPKVIVEGTAELTRGVDTIREDIISKSIEEHRKNNYLTDILDYDSFYENAFIAHPIKVTFDKDDANSRNLAKYASGYMLLRYLAKQCADKSITGGIRYATLPSNVEYIVTTEGNSTTNLGEKTTTIVKTENEKFSATVIGSAVVKQDEIRVHKNPLNIEGSAHDFSIIGGDSNDYVSLQGDNISINSGWGKDTIIVEGNDARISTAYERNEKISMAGGNKLITIIGNGAKVSTGEGSDKFIIRGNQNEIINKRDSGFINDNYTISAGALNNTIHNFEEPNFDDFDSQNRDKLWFESGEIAAEIQILNGTESVVISSAKTGETLVVLASVTSGSNNNIVYRKDDGGTMTTSIDWLLTNTTPISPGSNNPERPNFKTIIGTSYNDNINNSLASMRINALSGNDTISNSSSEVTVLGGIGNDSIHNKYDGSNSKIVGGENNDSITNDAENVTINGGDGDDNIYNSYNVKNVIIYGGTGNDSLRNAGTNVTMDGGTGDDNIYNCGATVSIVGGTGNDTIESDEAMGVVIYGGEGNDSLKNGKRSYASFIDGGEGKDTISNRSSSVIADGGADDDYITNYLNGYTHNVSISGNAGNDTILNIPLNGYYGTENESGAITLDGGTGDDSIYSSGYNIADVTTKNQNIGVIKGGAGNDSIYYDRFSTYTWEINYSGAVSIEGNEGEDLISIRGGGFATINAGNGNDKIYIDNDFASINAGIGNDTISINASASFEYAPGDGNDIIYLPTTNSLSIKIPGGTYGRIIKENDIILTVGEDSITLKNCKNKIINVSGESVSGAISLIGSEGNDDFYRVSANSLKSSDASYNYISNIGYINALDGDDYISHTVNSATLLGDTGNDTIYNSGNRALIDGGIGEDKLSNSGSNATIYGNDGNDSISNSGSNALVNGGTGNDTISNGDIDWRTYDENVTINGEDGDDLIINVCHNVTIYGGAGNDSIYNNYNSANIYIDGGEGNNLISLNPHDTRSITTTINVSGGTNTIEIDSSEFKQFNTFMRLNIEGFGVDDVITFSDAITSLNGSSNSLVAVVNKIPVTIEGLTFLKWKTENSLASYNPDGSSGIYLSDDSLSIHYSDSTIPAFLEIDGVTDTTNFSVSGATASLDASAFDSTVSVKSNAGNYNFWLKGSLTKSSTFIATKDADSIRNNVSDIIINGDAGNESINSSGLNSTINGGAGDDTVYNCADNIEINGDTDNDSINNYYADNITIAGGKGNDQVKNLWGNNVIINGNEGTDSIDNYGEEVLMNGDIDNDVLKNYASTVTINGGNGDDYIVSSPNLSFSSARSDYVSILGGKGNDTISNEYGGRNITIDGGSGNDSIYSGGSNNIITGNEGTDSLYIEGPNNTIDGGTGNDYIDIGGSNNKINGSMGNDSIINAGSLATIEGGMGNDLISLSSYYSENAMIKYKKGDGNDIIYGFNETSTLNISDSTYSTIASGKDIIVKVDNESITLKNAKGKILNIDGEEKIIWTLEGTTATYGNLITVKGVKSLDGISLSGTTVTVKESSLNKKNVTISDGYTLTLGNDAPKLSTSTVAHFDGLTYKSASSSEGYSLSSDKKSINYTPTVAESDLFTLTNVKNTDSITVNQSNKTVTLKANNLTGKNVSITGDYSLKLGNDVSTSTTKTAGSFTKFKSGTATFKTTAYNDFYSLKNNQVTYTAVSGGKTISIKNLKSSTTLDAVKSGITITEQKNGSCKITFKSSDLLTTKAPVISATDVTYTVALDKSLNPSALAPDWKVSGTNASLKSDTSAGYTVSDNKILYSKKVTGVPQLVFSGLVKNSSLSAPVKKVVTLDSSVLGSNTSLKSNAGSYTVKLTGNMSKKTFTGSANADSLNIAANNAAVLGGAGNDSFTVSGSKVTITGGKGNDSFKLSGKNPVLIYNTGDGNDTVNFVSGMQISLSGSTQIKTLGKSGSDLLLGFGKNSSVKITGAKSTDTLKVSDASGFVTLLAGKFDLADRLTFNSKNSSVTVAKNFSGSLAPNDDIYLGGSKLSSVATINASNVTSEITISANAKANFISAGKNNDSILGGNGNDSIAGNAGNDKLYGQNGNDSLSGGKGNDSLWGGDGKDVFIYSAGNDVIADFTVGQDKIQIASGKISKTSLSDSDVLFTIGKGSLTVKNAKGKTISLIDSAGKASSTVVGAQALTNSNKASVTIGADMGFVDSSARTKAIKITGNALGNTISGGTKNDSILGAAGNDSILGNAGNDKLYGDAGNDIIYGGKGNDSLWGGKGNDSLWGDAGNDTFFYITNEGTDKIFDYLTGDLLKILNADGTNGSFKSSKFSGGDLTLSINGGGKIIFENVTTTTKFNINDSYYNINGSKLAKK